MKKSMRAHIYAVPSESYTLAERIYFRHPKHGRTRKQHYLSKLGRIAIKKGRVDGINLKNVDLD